MVASIGCQQLGYSLVYEDVLQALYAVIKETRVWLSLLSHHYRRVFKEAFKLVHSQRWSATPAQKMCFSGRTVLIFRVARSE